MIIEQPSKWLRWLYPKAVWRMNPEEHAVYLTFDDGPIPEATPFILDTLAQYGAKATFFMVGDNVRKHPELFKRIVDEGHQVGNHTYHHLGSLRHWTATYLMDA
ncbi:MAG: polysaccharide deacetylase family protein, partial [Prevotella sp.]|nr:polysaccharide deacetylase family protein [Prevotella sp.]